jgi:hypothetical protein
METFHKEGHKALPKALDRFFENVSELVIVGGLIEVLLGDLNIDVKIIEKALIDTNWLRQTIDNIRSEFRKSKKANPVKYAESVRQLVEVFGLNYTVALLQSEGIGMKRSTIKALCRVGGETPKIKELLRKGLKLTIAFELPSIDEEDREKIAEELVSKNYAEAKRYLKKVKAS